MAEPAPPPPLPSDCLRNIFGRLPPEPAHLAAVSAVRSSWRSVVHDDDGFLGPFRAAHGGAPPLLGFFADGADSDSPVFVRTTNTSMSIPPPPAARRGGRMHMCDSRHGRVLMKKMDEGELLLWDPLTGGEHSIPTPPGFPSNYDTRFGAALICDAGDHGGHADCHSSPYRVAFAYTERRYSEASDLPDHRISACVYSSQTGTWGNLKTKSSLIFFHTFARKPCVVMDGNVVYWILLRDRAVLQFNIEAQSLTLIKPFANAFDLIVPTPKGRLGLVYVDGTSVVLSEREVSSGLGKWSYVDLVRLQDFIPPDASFSGVCSDQEERPGYRTWNIFRRLPGYELNGIEDNLIVNPRVIGFSEEENVVFVQSKVGVFTIDLISKRHSKVSNQTACFDAIHPYSSFYTTVGKAVFSEATRQTDHQSHSSQGEEIVSAAGSGANH